MVQQCRYDGSDGGIDNAHVLQPTGEEYNCGKCAKDVHGQWRPLYFPFCEACYRDISDSWDEIEEVVRHQYKSDKDWCNSMADEIEEELYEDEAESEGLYP